MPDGPHLLAFALAALVLALIPGPGMLYVLARSLGGGRTAGLRSCAGTAIGGMVHVVGAAVGVSAVLAASASAFTVVRLLGAAYLVWLGVEILRRAGEPPPSPGGAAAGDRAALRQGILTEALNPKTALFFLTFLPQFCQPERGPVGLQLLVLGTVSVAANTAVDVAVALGAGRLGERLAARPRAWRRQRQATGALLVGLGFAAGSTRVL